MSFYVPYITLRDYFATIQEGQLSDQVLDELSGGGDRERKFAESWAIEKIRSKIGEAYDLDVEFTPTLPYSFTKKYGAGNRFIIDFSDWSSSTSYELHSIVIKDSVGYICIVDSASGTWDESKWQSIGNQYSIFHLPYPYPVFSLGVKNDKGGVVAGLYNAGDIVWWNGSTYKNLIPTTRNTQQGSLNYESYRALPPVNVFPNTSTQHWENLGVYSIEGILPIETVEDVLVFTEEDNRNPLIIQAVIDLSLFQLHKRISPNNIPKLRIDQMQSTFAWLESVQEDEDTVRLATVQQQGRQRTPWGSKPRKVNGY